MSSEQTNESSALNESKIDVKNNPTAEENTKTETIICDTVVLSKQVEEERTAELASKESSKPLDENESQLKSESLNSKQNGSNEEKGFKRTDSNESVLSEGWLFIENYKRPYHSPKPRTPEPPEFPPGVLRMTTKDEPGFPGTWHWYNGNCDEKRKFNPPRAADILWRQLNAIPSQRTKSPEFSAHKKEVTASPAVYYLEPGNLSPDVDVYIDHITNGISEWMVTKSKGNMNVGLECVDRLKKFYIYDRIQIIDSLYKQKAKNLTENAMTLRNAEFQQLFFVATEKRGFSSFCSFKLIFVDQYCRRVMSIKKNFRCVCGLIEAVIEYPIGNVIGVMKQTRFWFKDSVEFKITDPKTMKRRFTIRRTESTAPEATTKYEFDIFRSSDVMGTVIKRYENVLLNNVVNEDHYVRVGLPLINASEDKALLICAGVLLNVLYLKKYGNIGRK